MTTFTDSLSGWFRRKRENIADGEDRQATTASVTTGGGSDQEPVVVWEAANIMEAHVVKGRLESEEIPAFISGEALGAIYGLTAGNLAMVKVLVPAPLADKALEILYDEQSEFDQHESVTGSAEVGMMTNRSRRLQKFEAVVFLLPWHAN